MVICTSIVILLLILCITILAILAIRFQNFTAMVHFLIKHIHTALPIKTAKMYLVIWVQSLRISNLETLPW